MNKNKSIKEKGRVYTPEYIVKNILDSIDYNSDILQKHIIDNSCGDGAFLVQVVKRYCERYCERYLEKSNDLNLLKKHLEMYIHGIEINELESKKCIENLNKTVLNFDISNVNWDIVCANTLSVEKYNNKMDFVVGNPPYVRVHNFSDNYNLIKNFSFAKSGMTDLYIVFFEIGFKMLSENGKMSLITPSSWLTSKAGKDLREYIYKKQSLKKIIDLEHFQPFETATTYCLISVFEKNYQKNEIDFYTYNSETKQPIHLSTLMYNEILIQNNFYFNTQNKLEKLQKINNNFSSKQKNIEVKNGFATLCDKVFIADFSDLENTIDVLKGSRGKWKKCIYPYTKNGNPIELFEIRKTSPKLYKFLEKNKEALLNRDIKDKKNWHLFGRNQGINDVYKNKISINTIIKNIESIKLIEVLKGKAVYSGLYILSDFSFKEIENAIKTESFMSYIKSLKKYKSGGYYTFSSLDLKKFLIHKLERNKNVEQELFENTN